MADDATLLTEARKLGGLIGNQSSVKNYRDLSRQLELDISARDLLEQFEQLMEQLAAKEAAMQPIEISEKQKAQSLQQSIAIHPLLKKLMAAQVEYMELMRKVQEAINVGISKPEEAGALPAEKPVSKLIL
ncbi:MAG TPA: YlbF family regulator [Phycisphaerae bacterium]|nr:YlbF family regulator [Phycisphaerae bacterium]